MPQTTDLGKKPCKAGIILGSRILLFSGLVLLFTLVSLASASGTVHAYIGDTIPLSGYSYSSQTVYLFLTGPNLPANGVALDNINNRADQGGFTQVSVDSNNHWAYDWNTGSIGGTLDAGSYTVWVVDGPNDLSNLYQAQYSTISVLLDTPGLGSVTATASSGTISTPVAVPGSLEINSIPDNVSVVVNGAYRGRAPLTIDGLNPGTYQINFSRFNYYPLSAQAQVESGVITEVNGTLKPETGTLVITTNPEGAQIVLDGINLSQSPVTQTGLNAGNHTINATLEGYVPVEVQVNVIADQSVNSTIELNKSVLLIPESFTPLPEPVTIAACIGAVIMFVFFRRRSGK
jgi:hypothetical protein